VHETSSVPNIFISDERFVVGEGDSDIAPVLIGRCDPGELLGEDVSDSDQSHPGIQDLFQFLFSRDLIILTKWTGEIAAVTANGENITSREKTCERLFFDGIQCERSDLAIVFRNDPSIPAYSGTAGAGPAFRQMAMMKADVADRHMLAPF
jgi:hypothetical protein